IPATTGISKLLRATAHYSTSSRDRTSSINIYVTTLPPSLRSIFPSKDYLSANRVGFTLKKGDEPQRINLNVPAVAAGVSLMFLTSGDYSGMHPQDAYTRDTSACQIGRAHV